MGLLLTKYLHLKFYPNLWHEADRFLTLMDCNPLVLELCATKIPCTILPIWCFLSANWQNWLISCSQNFSKFNQVQPPFKSEPDFTWVVSAENTMKTSWNFSQSWDKKQSYVLSRKTKLKLVLPDSEKLSILTISNVTIIFISVYCALCTLVKPLQTPMASLTRISLLTLWQLLAKNFFPF